MDSKLQSRIVGQRCGRYVLFDQIGMGGMATVHIARLLGPGGFSRTVAVKRLRGEFIEHPECVSMFFDEARLAVRIHHPNVVQVLDVVTAGPELFLVMEYVRGESLARLMGARSTRIPVHVVLAIATDMLYGLHAAHEATSERGELLRIVHRDVSPQNILITSDGIARVTDFGIAKAAVRVNSTRDGQLKGKIGYVAPEQVRRGPLDRRTDVFAASVVLWEMLTGERLFVADNPGAVLHRILYEPVPSPSSIVPDLPRGLDDIVLKGLSRERGDRFASARDMASQLEALGPARAAEVASWVDSSMGSELRERAARVLAIEHLSVVSDDDGADSPLTISAASMRPLSAKSGADLPTAPVSVDPAEPAPAVENFRLVEGAQTSMPWVARAAIGLAVASTIAGAGVFLAWRPAVSRPPNATSNVQAVALRVASAAPRPPSELPVTTPLAIQPSADGSAVRSVSKAPAFTARGKRRPVCDPPYTIDARGIRIYKRDCLNR